MSKTAEKIFVNTLMQGWIQDYLDNPHKVVSDDVQAILRRKYAQLEADTQRLLNPQPKQPRKPKAVPAVRETERGVTVVELPDGLRQTGNAITKRSRRDG